MQQPIVKTTNTIPTQAYYSPCLQLSLQHSNMAIKMGYGSGASLPSAKQAALYDIANQIVVNVQGQAVRKSYKKSAQVETQFTQKITTQAESILSSVEVACSDPNDPSGHIHIALRYDQRPLVDIFASRLKAQQWQAAAKIEWQGPSIITQSHFIHNIEKRLITTNVNNSIEAKPQQMLVQLFRKNQQWHLAINNTILPLEKQHYQDLLNWQYLPRGSSSVQLHNEKGRKISTHLRDGDDFWLVFNTNKQGYLSIFNIYEDGRVVKMRENIHATETERVKLPEHQGSFSAGLITEGQSTTDQYLFILTQQPINGLAFAQLGLDVNPSQADNNFHLNLFLGWLDQQELISSNMLEMTISPRQ